jgi:putative hydrolase of HD superfamily
MDFIYRDDSKTLSSSYLDLLLYAGRLKNLPRTGWRLVGIKDCESVADHSYRVILIAMLLGELINDVDQLKLLKMAVLHDLPESMVTDLPLAAVQVIGQEEKKRAESQAWDVLLNGNASLEGWRALWQAFEAGETIEAKLVKIADKLEMYIQAYEYQRAGFQDLDSFWHELELDDPVFRPIKELVGELFDRRAQCLGREVSSTRRSRG